VTFIVDNVAPFAAQTTPALISALDGGDVFTTNREAHVYVPPRGLQRDAMVSIEALDTLAVPTLLPDGAIRVSPGFSIATNGAPVRISFTLAREGPVRVTIHNRAGRLIRIVTSGQTLGPGTNVLTWDGRDEDRREVDSGLYLVTVEALGTTRTGALAVVR